MTRINHADQVLLLLREQLQRATKGREAGAGKAAQRVEGRVQRPLDRVRALAALDGLADDAMRRAMVRGLLSEEFGDALGNDAAFAAMTDNILRTLETLPGGPELITQAIAQLKGQA